MKGTGGRPYFTLIERFVFNAHDAVRDGQIAYAAFTERSHADVRDAVWDGHAAQMTLLKGKDQREYLLFHSIILFHFFNSFSGDSCNLHRADRTSDTHEGHRCSPLRAVLWRTLCAATAAGTVRRYRSISFSSFRFHSPVFPV
jgi:hypothetical protein